MRSWACRRRTGGTSSRSGGVCASHCAFPVEARNCSSDTQVEVSRGADDGNRARIISSKEREAGISDTSVTLGLRALTGSFVDRSPSWSRPVLTVLVRGEWHVCGTETSASRVLAKRVRSAGLRSGRTAWSTQDPPRSREDTSSAPAPDRPCLSEGSMALPTGSRATQAAITRMGDDESPIYRR